MTQNENVKFVLICTDNECIQDVFWTTTIEDACSIAKNYRSNSDNPKEIKFEIFEIQEHYNTYKVFLNLKTNDN